MGFFDRKPQSNYKGYTLHTGRKDGLGYAVLRREFGTRTGEFDENLGTNIGPSDTRLSKPLLEIRMQKGEEKDPVIRQAALAMGIING